MSAIKLFYFPLRARGEACRLVLAASGTKWEDVRIPFDEWPKQKSKAPYGQLPYLEYEGKTYGQSIAIANFLARLYNFYGKTPVEQLRVDEVVGIFLDLIQAALKVKFENDETTKAEKKQDLVKNDIPKYFEIFERLLKENGGSGYFVGKSATLADFVVYDIVDTIEVFKSGFLADYPLVQKLRKNVSEIPNVKAYLAKRPQTDV